MAGDEVLWRGRASMMSDPVRLAIDILLIPVAGFGLYLLFRWWLDSINTRASISRDRVTLRRGILSKYTTEVRIADVRNVQVAQSFLQRILRIGNVAVSSAAHNEVEVFIAGVRHPEAVAELIRKLQRNEPAPMGPAHSTADMLVDAGIISGIAAFAVASVAFLVAIISVVAWVASQSAPAQRPGVSTVKAARAWSLEQTARAFLVTAATVASWKKRLEEEGPEALVQLLDPHGNLCLWERVVPRDIGLQVEDR